LTIRALIHRCARSRAEDLALLTTGTLGEPAGFANAIILAPGSRLVRGDPVAIGQIRRSHR
jgi:hypothetical protein